MYRSEPLHCESLIHTGMFSLKAILCLKHWLKNDLLWRCQLQKTPCTWLHLGRVSPAAETPSPPPSSDPPIFSFKSLVVQDDLPEKNHRLNLHALRNLGREILLSCSNVTFFQVTSPSQMCCCSLFATHRRNCEGEFSFNSEINANRCKPFA